MHIYLKWLYDKEEEEKYDFKAYMLKKGPLKDSKEKKKSFLFICNML